jgi:hypothetical protein
MYSNVFFFPTSLALHSPCQKTLVRVKCVLQPTSLITSEFLDETLPSYLERLRLTPDYAGRKDFISNTTWIPSTSAGFCLANSKLMNPMHVSVVGQLCATNSALDPFGSTTTWSLPKTFADQLCTFTITDPWLFGASFHNDFLRAIKHLCVLSDSPTFPSFGQPNFNDTSCLDIEQLYNGRLVLHIPFFRKRVTFLHFSNYKFTYSCPSVQRPIQDGKPLSTTPIARHFPLKCPVTHSFFLLKDLPLHPMT